MIIEIAAFDGNIILGRNLRLNSIATDETRKTFNKESVRT